jgi:hypothetical protein
MVVEEFLIIFLMETFTEISLLLKNFSSLLLFSFSNLTFFIFLDR